MTDINNQNIQNTENLAPEVETQEAPELEEMLEEIKQKDEEESTHSDLLSQVKDLTDQIKEKEEIAKNSQIAYLHLKSDFDILQRQTEQKIQNANRDAIITVAKKFLPLVENLRKSLLNLSPEQQETSMGKGIKMMYDGFLKNLEAIKIEAIPAVGLAPDPQFHEPVSMQTTEDEALKGKIIQEFEQGFVFKDGEETLVIIPSKVIVWS